jgi:GAF domain-containing protein
VSVESSSSTAGESARTAALEDLVRSAADNIPGVDFASVTLRSSKGRSLQTVAATDQLAHQADELQYKLNEGPCYAAVTDERLVLVNDLWTSSDFPRYGSEAVDIGLGSQLAVQLLHDDGQQAGLNLYAHRREAFDRSTIQLAELFATQAAAILQFATQVEQLEEALHTRTDIGIAVGIAMERYGIDRDRAFSFLVRNSNQRNQKLRALAHELIDGTFTGTTVDTAGGHDVS